MSTNINVQEKIINPINGFISLFTSLLLFGAGGTLIYFSIEQNNNLFRIIASIIFIVGALLLAGLKILKPNEALVLVMFGKYYGTIKKPGFYFVNPFATSALSANLPSKRKVSLKTMTINKEKQKVNDLIGNPILIGAVVIWRVVNPTKVVFSVENYKEYLTIQSESTIRNIARLYPYDQFEEDESLDKNEKTLRGSSQEIADRMRQELQEKVEDAGLYVEEVRITDLAYSEEIAAAMLQRQQAVAIISARKKIVEGAVGMVNTALEQLDRDNIVVLDEERKAAMVSNLLVVLCSNKDANPVINSGSIY